MHVYYRQCRHYVVLSIYSIYTECWTISASSSTDKWFEGLWFFVLQIPQQWEPLSWSCFNFSKWSKYWPDTRAYLAGDILPVVDSAQSLWVRIPTTAVAALVSASVKESHFELLVATSEQWNVRGVVQAVMLSTEVHTSPQAELWPTVHFTVLFT